jgi:hypothetical protein
MSGQEAAMRTAAVWAIVGAAMLGTGMIGTAQAQPYLKGNDTGGMISWSCEAELMAQQIAGEHCAWYGKYHRITSVHRMYGDYISFQCLWNPRLARFAIPAVRTRTRACPSYGPAVSARY